jgi:hypothetical protein
VSAVRPELTPLPSPSSGKEAPQKPKFDLIIVSALNYRLKYELDAGLIHQYTFDHFILPATVPTLQMVISRPRQIPRS